MGVWGIGSFENDAALDWARSLIHSNNYSLVEETLRKYRLHNLRPNRASG